MNINRALIWDYDFSAKDLNTEEFKDWYLGRALARGSAGDIRAAGGAEEVRKRLPRLHLPLEIERLWSWYLGIPGPRPELYGRVNSLPGRFP